MMSLPAAFTNPEARAIAEQGAHLATATFDAAWARVLAARERSLSGLTARYPTNPTWAGDERATMADALPAGLPSALANAAHGGMRSAGRYVVCQSVGGKWEARALVESFKLAEPHLENARAEGYEACIVRVDEPPPLKGCPILANAFMGHTRLDCWYEVRQLIGDQWMIRAMVDSLELAGPHAENARAEGYEVHIVRVGEPA